MIAQQQIVLLAVLERTFAFMLFCLVIRLCRFDIGTAPPFAGPLGLWVLSLLWCFVVKGDSLRGANWRARSARVRKPFI